MNDFDDILRDGLAADAGRVDPGRGDLPRVHQVAASRRRRMRLAVSVGTAVFVVFVVAAAAGVRTATRHAGDDRSPVRVNGDDGQGSPSVTAGPPVHDPLTLVPSTTTWKSEVVPYGQGLGSLQSAGRRVHGTGPLVALSTAPGSAPNLDGPIGSDEWLYHSTDGVHWTGVSLAGNARGDQRWLTELDQRGDKLVGVGTAAASAPVGEAAAQGAIDLVVSTSSDGGATFHDAVLPFDLRGANAQLKGSIYVGFGASVAVGEHGTMVGLTLAASPSVVLPAEARSSPIQIVADGIQVLDPPPCSPYGGPPEVPRDDVATVAPTVASQITVAPTSGPSVTFPASGIDSVPESLLPSAVDSVPEPSGATVGSTLALPSTTVVVADPAATVPPLKPIGASGCESNFPATTVANVTSTTGAPIVRHTYTWQDLGLGDDAVAALTSQPLVFFAADGEHFIRVTLPSSADGGHPCGPLLVTATASGFALAVTRCGPNDGLQQWLDTVPAANRSTDVYRTTDGVQLDALDPLPFDGSQLFQSGGFTALGDTIVVQAVDAGFRPVVAVATASSWSLHDIRRSVEQVAGTPMGADGCCYLAAGPGGMVVVASTVADPVVANPPAFHDGGITLRILDQSGTIEVVDDATGDTLYRGRSNAIESPRLRVTSSTPTATTIPATTVAAPATTVMVDRGQTPVGLSLPYDAVIEVLGTDGGVRARFRASDIAQTVVDLGPVRTVVLHSPDGITWAGEELTPGPGETIAGINSVAVLGDKIVVSTFDATPDPGVTDVGGYHPTQTVAYVGSFR